MRERRAYVRVPAGLEVTYQIAQPSVPARLGMGEDLSFGGMRLWLPERLDPGHKLSLNLTFPEGIQTTFQGMVVWSQEVGDGKGGFRCGIRWAALNPISQARLNAFLTSRTRPSPDSLKGTTSSAPKPPIFWPRAIALAALGFALLTLAGILWVEWYRLTTETNSLHVVVRNAERLIQHLLKEIPR